MCTGLAESDDVMADGSSVTLSLSLFGGLRIELDGVDAAEQLPGRQGRALVAFLVLNRDRTVGRDELLNVLWPAQPPAAPEAALNSVLAKVRRALAPVQIIGRQALKLALPTDCAVDVRLVDEQTELAERAAATGDLETALAAAQAALEVLAQPLLPDIDGDWMEAWRRHFEQLVPRALETSARAGLALGSGRLPAAERAAGALIDCEPFREVGYALLMRAQAKQGNVAEALRTFERVRVFLSEELGARPSATLVALHESLLRDDAKATAAPGTPAIAAPQRAARSLPAVTARKVVGTFVGRERFCERLRLRWRESRPGQPQLVLLVGDAGVGKTRLAAEFAAEVHASGATVLYGRADEDALLPHQPFVEALQHLLSLDDPTVTAVAQQDREILSRLLPDLGPGASHPDTGSDGNDGTLRYRLFEAVANLLCAAGRQSPLLLILDDLHWADKPTLLLLRHVLRHPQLGGLLVVGTFRHVEVGRDHPLTGLLTDLRREQRYDRLTITGLDENATRALVADRLGSPVDAEFAGRLRAQTEGNAFFIEETIRALLESGLPPGETVTAGALDRIGMPEGISQIVSRRVSHLSPLAEKVLTAASVIGRDFRLQVVAQIVAQDPAQVMDVLEESMAAGLVVEHPERIDVLTFSHALVREVLYDAISVSRRVRLHHDVARALEQATADEGANPAELKHHFLLARHFAGTAPARRYAIEAGDRAMELLAYEEAVEHYTHAVDLFEHSDAPERCEALLALGRAQWRAGARSARETFRDAASCAAQRGDADQLSRAALGYSARYHESEYAGPRDRELLEQALAAIDDGDSARRVLLLSRLAGNAAFTSGRRRRGSALSAQAVAMARRLGDDDVLSTALMARHATMMHVRDLDERLELSEEFMGLRVGHRELLVERRHWRLYDLLENADFALALGEQPGLDALATDLRQPQWLSIAVGWRGIWAELAGDIEQAERYADEGLRHGERAHMRDALSTWAAKLLMLRRRQGRLPELAGVIERLVHGADVRRTGWRSAHGLILAETGDEAAAHSIYQEEFAGYPEAPPPFWLTNITILSELAVALGDGAGARTLYDALAPHARRNVVVSYSSCWGPVDRYLAVLAATFGDERLRRRHARSALVHNRAMNAPLLIAELREQHGALLDP